MQRNYLIDNVKGWAIFLVVWGHAIQYFGGSDYDFFDNKVFMVIYSFHMPLFMFISGYLFTNSPQKRTVSAIFKTKFQELIIPMVLWNGIFTLILFGNRLLLEPSPERLYYVLQMYTTSLPHNLWFFWVLFVSLVIVAVLARTFKNSPTVLILSILAVLAVPEYISALKYVKFMYPYFVAGYIYNRYANNLNSIKHVAQVASGIIFLYGISIWSRDYYIYNTGFAISDSNELSNTIKIIIVRYAMGFAGVYLLISALRNITFFRTKTWLATIGTMTYGIYIIQAPLLPIFSTLIKLFSSHFLIYNFIYTPVLAVLFIILSLLIAKTISKNKITNTLLLGARKTSLRKPSKAKPSTHEQAEIQAI